MTLNHAEYIDIRSNMQTGDIIAFSGRARVSRLVQRATGSVVSHCGIVCHSAVSYYGHTTVELIESVKEAIHPETGQIITGVHRSRLSTRIRYYDGDIWWLPLSHATRQKLNYTAAISFLMSVIGRPYDVPQAILSAIDCLDNLPGKLTYACEDYSALFCSELAAGALKAGGAIPGSHNPSEMTPIDLCRLPIYFREYYQIKGCDPRAIDF